MSALHKTCSRCKESKPLSAFPKAGANELHGVHCYCKVCKNTYAKQWRGSPQGKASLAKRDHRKEHLAYRYGITEKEYVALMEAAGHQCQICGDTSHRLYVDHEHKTGTIRGLLCRKCNLVLGFARDNVDVLQKAITYLAK